MSKFEANDSKGVNGLAGETEIRRVGKRGAIACFVAGTKILTIRGQRAIEELVPGDRVMTRDHGLQEVRWIGCRHIDASEIQDCDTLRLVRIAKGALGNGMPDRDLLISPEQSVLVSGDLAATLLVEDETLIAAKDLVGRKGITVEQVEGVIFYHLMFDEAALLLVEGTWTEGFLPGLKASNGPNTAAMDEIYAIYPELRVLPTPFKAARPAIDPVIAKMLSADAGLLINNPA